MIFYLKTPPKKVKILNDEQATEATVIFAVISFHESLRLTLMTVS